MLRPTAVHLEQSGGVGLGHLGLQGSLVVAGGGGQHGDLHTGLLRIDLRQFLPLGIGLGLEVHEIDLAAGRRVAVAGRSRTAGIGSVSAAAAQKGQGQAAARPSAKSFRFISNDLLNFIFRLFLETLLETFPVLTMLLYIFCVIIAILIFIYLYFLYKC